jgi:hypothetical protein
VTEITFRFVIELSEETRDFLWELVDEIQGRDNENGEDESDTGSASDTPV